MSKLKYIFGFEEIESDNAQEVGPKAVSLSEMAQLGFPIPQGFVISPRAFEDFIEQNNLNKTLSDIAKTVNKENIKETQSASSNFSRLIQKANFPKELKEEILEAYGKLGGLFKQAHVAVRPSLVSQDSAKSNALGHLNTSLNIQGEASLLETVKKYWSTGAGVAIIVQKMVEAESAGVAFTIDPTDGNKHRVFIEAVWGQGELLTSGQISPDKYLVERHSLKIESISVSPQKYQLVLTGNTVHTKRVSARKQKKQKLTVDQITSLAKILQMVHAHYYFPQDIEWAFSHGQFYILHARPVTTTSQQMADSNQLAIESRKPKAVLLKGQGASPGIVKGHVRIIKSRKDLSKVKKGEILVFEKITPDLIPFFKLAGGVVTNQGGVTSHAALITRELGIPCVVGVDNATRKLKDGVVVTLNGNNGEVTESTWKTEQKQEKQLEVEIKPNQEIKTVTKIYLNLAEPEEAKEAAKLPSAGIGLLRAEFMISE
ncbi:MAG: pyruvate water dikinase, partial [bacterium]